MGSKHAAQRRSFLIWDAEILSHHPKRTVRAKGSGAPAFKQLALDTPDALATLVRYFSSWRTGGRA
jgi:hypothetical protein